MKCKRCDTIRESKFFLADSNHFSICKYCYTDEERKEYCLPEISKIMKDLNAKEKKAVIKSLLLEYKLKKRKQHV